MKLNSSGNPETEEDLGEYTFEYRKLLASMAATIMAGSYDEESGFIDPDKAVVHAENILDEAGLFSPEEAEDEFLERAEEKQIKNSERERS